MSPRDVPPDPSIPRVSGGAAHLQLEIRATPRVIEFGRAKTRAARRGRGWLARRPRVAKTWANKKAHAQSQSAKAEKGGSRVPLRLGLSVSLFIISKVFRGRSLAAAFESDAIHCH